MFHRKWNFSPVNTSQVLNISLQKWLRIGKFVFLRFSIKHTALKYNLVILFSQSACQMCLIQQICQTTSKDIGCETLLCCQLLPCLTTPSQLHQCFQVMLTAGPETTVAELLSKIKTLTVLFCILMLWPIKI